MKHFKVCFLLLLWHITFSNVDGQFFSSGQEQARNPQNLQSPVLNNLMPDQQRSAQFRAKQTFGYGRDEQVSKGVMELAVKIGKAIGKENSKNEIFSPVSIAGALSLLLLGANGKTHDELNKVMGYGDIGSLEVHENFGKLLKELVADQPNTAIPYKPVNWKVTDKCNDVDYFETKNEGGSYNQTDDVAEPKDESVHQIKTANGIFVQNGYQLNPDYVEAAENIYQSKIINLNFKDDSTGASIKINDWVNEETKGKIPEIISGGLSAETKMIIASALYFKAEWKETFIDGATSMKDFFPDGKSEPPVKAELMAHGGCFPYYEDKEADVRIMGFPYKQNFTTMYIILPNNSSRRTLKDFHGTLTADAIEKMIEMMVVRRSIVLFPKMHVTNKINLKDTLRNLGVRMLFKRGGSDLSLISNGTEEKITPIYQRRPLPTFTTTPKPKRVQQTTPTYSMPSPIEKEAEEDDTRDRLIFSRIGNNTSENKENCTTTSKVKREVKYKVVGSAPGGSETLTFKDLVLRKRITKENSNKKSRRSRRQASDGIESLRNLDQTRNGDLVNPGLFADSVVHKIDLEINETGTEGGAATAITLNRSGSVISFRVDTPFLILIRHDATKLPLFYGNVFDPNE